jgi:hypothetical protein
MLPNLPAKRLSDSPPDVPTKKTKLNNDNSSADEVKCLVWNVTGCSPLGHSQPTATLFGDRQIRIEFPDTYFEGLLADPRRVSSLDFLTCIASENPNWAWWVDAQRCPGALVLPRYFRLADFAHNLKLKGDTSDIILSHYRESVSFLIDMRRCSLLDPIDKRLIPPLRDLVYSYYQEPGMRETCHDVDIDDANVVSPFSRDDLHPAANCLEAAFHLSRRHVTARIYHARYRYWKYRPGGYRPIFRQTDEKGVECRVYGDWMNMEDPLNPLFRPVCVVKEMKEVGDDVWEFSVNDGLFKNFHVKGQVKFQ